MIDQQPAPSIEANGTEEVAARQIFAQFAANELVFAVVGHVGSGTTTIATALQKLLQTPDSNGDSYDTIILKARNVIADWAKSIGESIPQEGTKEIEAAERYQDLGDKMRLDKKDFASVAKRLIRKIVEHRASKTGVTFSDPVAVQPDGKRRAYILDSIRHPAEVELLRRVYQDAFILIGVVCEEERRRSRVMRKYSNAGEDKARDFMQRDAKSAQKHGQRVSDAFHNNTPAFDQLAKGVKIPHFKYYRLVGSFAPAHEFQSELPSDLVFEERYRIGLPDFLKGRPPEMPGAGPADTHRIAISLIRQAWNLTASSRGLLPFETASGSLAWYAPKGVVQGDKVSFTDSNGVARRKTLVGWSAKRAVHWHFAVEMKPSLGPQPHLTARSHVIFTLDGRLPLENKAKMHSLRRSFCRSWWNDRWRDLLLAFAWWISGGAKTFNLMTGGADPLIVSAKPMQMISPISLFELRDREIMSPDEEDVDWDDPDIESDELLGDEVDEPGSDDGALPE